jgi:hypothetical protein
MGRYWSEIQSNLRAMNGASNERAFLSAMEELATYLAYFCAAKGEELNPD